ncbi:MAG: cation:proton antiporter [Polyangiaceae bacterium]|nr:cation:proton antiporter [Polyangiaceae bacterium]
MDPVLLFLLAFATIFIVGILGEVVFERTGVPDVVWLMVVGILLGPVSGIVQREQLMAIGPFFGALTLVVVLFDGGRQLRLADVSRSLPRASLLAFMGFAFSVLTMTLATMGAAALGFLPSGWTIMHGVIFGAILGGSSSVVIMPTLAKARLAPRLSAMVNLESALTDVLCVVVAVACINILVSGSSDFLAAVAILGKSFGIGLAAGVTVGMLWVLFMRLIRRMANVYAATLSILLLLYVFVSMLGGNAALGILAAAVVVGNASKLANVTGLDEDTRLGETVEDTHSQITFIVKSFFFTFIGAMLGPPWGFVALGLLFAVLLFLARVPSAALCTWGGGFSPAERQLTAVMMPRGMAAGVLALMPHAAGVPGTELLPVIVFSVVLGSIVIFAVGFPLARRGIPSVPGPDATELRAEPPDVAPVISVGAFPAQSSEGAASSSILSGVDPGSAEGFGPDQG